MINTSCSVKPRVVIFHMAASRSIRSITTVFKAGTVPNVVARVCVGKQRPLAETSSGKGVESVKTVDCRLVGKQKR